jgi:hypothetical protein
MVSEIVCSECWWPDQEFGDFELVSCGLQIFVRRGDIDSSNGKRENFSGSIARRTQEMYFQLCPSRPYSQEH